MSAAVIEIEDLHKTCHIGSEMSVAALQGVDLTFETLRWPPW